MTMPNASKHRGSAAHVRRRAGPRAGVEPVPGVGAICPSPADAPELAEAGAAGAGVPGRKAKAAVGFRERKRVILNLLRAVRSGRLQSAEQLGPWGMALLAARLIADAPEGLSLTPAGREMLTEMSSKHAASAAAPSPPGPAASVGEPDDRIEQTATIATS